MVKSIKNQFKKWKCLIALHALTANSNIRKSEREHNYQPLFKKSAEETPALEKF